MSDIFQPVAADQLAAWVFSELDARDSVFGIPRRYFFTPRSDAPYRTSACGHDLETPFGPAAGPHSQMAQNIVAAWLCGARYIELKTVQTLDVLNVSKPCIDMQDEGYNVEWSQELKVFQSFDEYLRAWVMIHALHRKLGFPGERPGIVFNLSVGYDLEGIRRPNMQWFLDQVQDCSAYKQSVVEQVARYCPEVRDIHIPDRISDNVTLSTMHGCPPGEVESISSYLLQSRGLHTLVKCNPTLLGPERVRKLINEELRFTDIAVPDAAFEHDLKYADAVPMLRNLQATAGECGLTFGVKLTNTLEVDNVGEVFDASEKTMYLSGRPLHAVTVNLANRLAIEFDGGLPMSFSAGASCFNAAELLAAGMQTVTVCSDLLKTGGYMRLLDYVESVDAAFETFGAASIDEFILRSANGTGTDVPAAARHNLRRYAERVRCDPDNMKDRFDKSRTKTTRELGPFDCVKAPCIDECPLDQQVPQYMRAVQAGDYAKADRIVRRDNPIPCVLGRACDHLCEQACVRTHLDEPLAIRDIKRFITDRVPNVEASPANSGNGRKVAVIGAGPGGIAAAIELAREGIAVEVFEQHSYAGGMVGGAVPEYRLPQAVFDKDFELLDKLGVRLHYNVRLGRDIRLSTLRNDGFTQVAIMVGAQRGKTLRMEGEDCDGVVDALKFLRLSRENRALDIGKRVGVIGAGDTAMDCARVAWRQNAGQSDSKVSLIYRRTIDEMPADEEELAQLVEEGIEILELCKPQRLVVEHGKLKALVCRRTRFAGDRDAGGRKIPHEVPDSNFEVPLDTLILAISQQANLDFFDDDRIKVNDAGYIDADPVTFETSMRGVYAGGDVANEGPASIVRAAAAGKAIADHIVGRSNSGGAPTGLASCDTRALTRRRSHRERRIHAPWTRPDERRNFNEVVLTYSEAQARAEAKRCIDCDAYCSICVGVCPNLALLTYETAAFAVRLPELHVVDGETRVDYGDTYRVAQPYQVAVLGDLCNECGNCTTFCPTSGRPFRDKPRLFIDHREFEQQTDNAYRIFRNEDRWAMDARYSGATHRIELNGDLDYIGPAFKARLDSSSFEVGHAEAAADAADSLSLRMCADMFVLLDGLRRSMPFLPFARRDDESSMGKIGHPGYEE